MKNVTLFLILILFQSVILAQTSQSTRVEDWNNVWQTGAYESEYNKLNAPGNGWYIGYNIGSKYNSADSNANAQFLFELNQTNLFYRISAGNGHGDWVKVLNNKGDQNINGNLLIAGKIEAKEIQVKVDAGADHVFHPEYKLTSLSDLKSFVEENKHLPDIPSEKQMQTEGLNVNEFQIKILQKIEELTLYVIKQQEEINKLKLQTKR